MTTVTRSTTRLFKRGDDSIPVSPQSALFGRKRRSQTEGGERTEGSSWARLTAKVSARLNSLASAQPHAQSQPQPCRAQTPTLESMLPRRVPLQTVELELEVKVEPRKQPFVHPYDHPFLKESSPPPPVQSRRQSLLPPPRSSSRRLSMQSSASDVTYVSVPHTPTTKYAPSFPPRSTSPTRKFPTPLPTPPQSAKHTEFPQERNHTRHTTQFLDEHVQQAWSNHPFAFSPSGRRSKSTSDPFKADFGAIFGVEEQPHEIVANYVDQQHPTPDSSPLMLPVELPFVNSSKARPRRGTFGSGDAPTYSGQCNENDFRRRQRYQYQDAYERAYACEGHGRWR